MKYIICGFSGAGKSYILQHLRENPSLSSYQCIDLDSFLLENVAKSYGELGKFITSVGWDEFRKQEEATIYQLLNKDQVIIALGGGTLNKKMVEHVRLDSNCHGLWLDIPFETCWERIKNDTNRPLVLKGKESLYAIYLARCELYKHFQSVKSLHEIKQVILSGKAF